MTDLILKSHKIASAVYLITGFFNDSEPLKWRLRSLSADLVSEGQKDKLMLLRDIRSLFTVAKAANLLSEQNYDILAQEIGRFQESLNNPLDKELFKEDPPLERALPEPKPVAVVKDKIIQEPYRRELLGEPLPRPLKDFGAVSVKKNSRQSVIIGLLKRKKEIMIKDVSPLISGCSEKTIQRELSAMVAAGILRKMGEKRWSRYTLA
jgi:hypothetical protein